MNCPRCGDELLPNARHCINCGSELDDEVLELAASEKKRNERAAFRDSSDLLKLALFSVIYPGFAHAVYLGEFPLGAAIAAGFTLLLAFAHAFVGTYYLDMPALFGAYLIYGLAPVHAFRLYRAKYNVAEDSDYRAAAFVIRYFVIIATAAIFIVGYSNYQGRFYYVISVGTAAYEPNFLAGDRLLASLAGPGPRPPGRGEIALFSVGRTVYRGAVAYGGGEYFERIIGLPGETVRFETEEIFINGAKLAPGFFPLSKNAMAEVEKKEYILGADEYLVVVNASYAGREVSFAQTIPRHAIRGRIVYLAWPLSRRGWIEPRPDRRRF